MRKLRVYAVDGGFELDIPDEARVTFGYFNPSAAGGTPGNPWNEGPGKQTMKTTALRVYKKTGPKTEDQIACFLGVTGFRDLDTIYEKRSPNDPL